MKNPMNDSNNCEEQDLDDKFIQEIQKPVMKEIWNNKKDEIWNKV